MAVLLGRQSAGTSTDFNAASHCAVWKFTATTSGDVATLWAQTKVTNATITSVDLAIYDDDAANARPLNLLGAVTGITAGVTGTGTFNGTLGTPVTVTSGTVYWLGWRGIGEQWDFQGSTAGAYLEATSTSSFAVNNPWPAGASSGTIDAILWGESAAATVLITTYRPVRIANSNVGPMALRRKFVKPYIIFNPSTNIIYQQALTATVTSTASIQKQINKIMSATSTTTSTIQKQANKALNATVTTISSIVRTILKNLVGNATSTATIQKQTNKPLNTTVTTTASMQRTTLKNLIATVTTTATLQALKVIVVTMVANVTTTATMQKLVNKTLVGQAFAFASMIKLINKTMSATATVTGVMSAVKAGVVAGVARGVKFLFSHRGYY